MTQIKERRTTKQMLRLRFVFNLLDCSHFLRTGTEPIASRQEFLRVTLVVISFGDNIHCNADVSRWSSSNFLNEYSILLDNKLFETCQSFSTAQITFEEVYSKLLGSGNLLDNKLLETYQSSLLQSSRRTIAIFSVAVSSGDYSNLFGSKPFGSKPFGRL